MSLLVFDLDYFKRINDIWGHETGDRVLQKISTATQSYHAKKSIVSVALTVKSSWWFYLILH
ncbi:MAG: diguanylate cyclase (GGDEF)-like protein [Cognaticolwellia sp.]|jgi:diguanylate cyclase (GGDEF)-like protein